MREFGEGSFSIAASPIVARIKGFTLSRQVVLSSRFGSGNRWHCAQMLVARPHALAKGTFSARAEKSLTSDTAKKQIQKEFTNAAIGVRCVCACRRFCTVNRAFTG